jgi:hypothetical protein
MMPDDCVTASVTADGWYRTGGRVTLSSLPVTSNLKLEPLRVCLSLSLEVTSTLCLHHDARCDRTAVPTGFNGNLGATYPWSIGIGFTAGMLK